MKSIRSQATNGGSACVVILQATYSTLIKYRPFPIFYFGWLAHTVDLRGHPYLLTASRSEIQKLQLPVPQQLRECVPLQTSSFHICSISRVGRLQTPFCCFGTCKTRSPELVTSQAPSNFRRHTSWNLSHLPWVGKTIYATATPRFCTCTVVTQLFLDHVDGRQTR
jgi:hypothetical protein